VVADVLVFLAVVTFPVIVAGLVLLALDRDARRDSRRDARRTRRGRQREGRQRGGRHSRWLAVAR
jgi:hypothetical protein